MTAPTVRFSGATHTEGPALIRASCARCSWRSYRSVPIAPGTPIETILRRFESLLLHFPRGCPRCRTALDAVIIEEGGDHAA